VISRVPGMTGHAKALTGAIGSLALIIGVAAAAPAAVAAPSAAPAATSSAASSAQAAAAVTLATGDSRSVSQPTVPSACTTLSAQLETSDEQFSSSDESTPPDTSRIQSALNSCSGTGKAVVLARAAATTPS
jgi:polygalacturonase